MTLELTERGQYAAEVVRTAIEAVDTELEKQLDAEQVANFRTALGTLIEMRNDPIKQ